MERFRLWSLLLLTILAVGSGSSNLNAQCPMCKAAVTSGSNDGKGTDGKGSALASNLNTGILYLFVLPYSAIMLVAIVVYRGYKKRKKQVALEQRIEAENAAKLSFPEGGDSTL